MCGLHTVGTFESRIIFKHTCCSSWIKSLSFIDFKRDWIEDASLSSALHFSMLLFLRKLHMYLDEKNQAYECGWHL